MWNSMDFELIGISLSVLYIKKLENFGGHLLSEDDHSYWAPPYWNRTKETFSLGRTEL